MSRFTDKEIALCRRLHEFGVRLEIRQGDWVIENGMSPELVGDDAPLYQRTQIGRNRYVLLLTWSQCREWLGEKGYNRIRLICVGQRIWIQVATKEGIEKEALGQTDCECALAVMVQVAESENK